MMNYCSNTPMDIADIRRANLKACVSRDGLAAFSKRVGKPDSQINDMIVGRKSFGERIARQIEKAYAPDLPLGWLDKPPSGLKEFEHLNIYSDIVSVPLRHHEYEDILVAGTIKGLDNGYIIETENARVNGEHRISYMAKNKNTYALIMRGDSMRPRIKDGEYIIVDPDHEAISGDEVVIFLLNGKRMIKEYLYQRDGMVTLGAINGSHDNITIDAQAIQSLHCIAAILPRGSYITQK